MGGKKKKKEKKEERPVTVEEMNRSGGQEDGPGELIAGMGVGEGEGGEWGRRGVREICSAIN